MLYINIYIYIYLCSHFGSSLSSIIRVSRIMTLNGPSAPQNFSQASRIKTHKYHWKQVRNFKEFHRYGSADLFLFPTDRSPYIKVVHYKDRVVTTVIDKDANVLSNVSEPWAPLRRYIKVVHYKDRVVTTVIDKDGGFIRRLRSRHRRPLRSRSSCQVVEPEGSAKLPFVC